MDVTNGFASSVGLTGPLLLVLYAIAALTVFRLLAPWLAENRLLDRFASRLATTFSYFMKGVGTLIVIVAVALPFYALTTVDGQTRGIAAGLVVAAVGAYIGLAALGWVGEQIVARYIEAHPDHESWEDIWPDTGADSDELREAAD